MRELLLGWLGIGLAVVLLTAFAWMVEQAEPPARALPEEVVEGVPGEPVSDTEEIPPAASVPMETPPAPSEPEAVPGESPDASAEPEEPASEREAEPTASDRDPAKPFAIDEPVPSEPEAVPGESPVGVGELEEPAPDREAELTPPDPDPEQPFAVDEPAPIEASAPEPDPLGLPELCPLLESPRSYGAPEIGEGMMVTPLSDARVRAVYAGEVLEVARGADGLVTVYLGSDDGTLVSTYAGLTSVFCAVGQKLPCGSEVGEQPAEQPFRFAAGRRSGDAWWSFEPIDVAPFLGIARD